jgi:glycerophosphoryl diester phosphodiesterase
LNSPLIIGHRGASAVAPENTLGAFVRALQDGADGVELDVRLARDRVPVVIHDATLRRTGLREGNVAEMTSAELGQIDVGRWFSRAHPQLTDQEHAGQFVQTLDQVFRFFNQEASRDAAIYVELKTDKTGPSPNELANSVVQRINEWKFRSRVVVVSFDLNALAVIKEIDGGICTGALFEPRSTAGKLMTTRRMITSAVERGAEEILLHRLMATRKHVRWALENELRPVVWTVDDSHWMRRANALGLHAVITNAPAKMAASHHSRMMTRHLPLSGRVR